MPEFRCLNTFTAAPYESLTSPYFQARLNSVSDERRIVAIGASCESQPAGLALAELAPDRHLATIRSVFVAPTHRRRGIGTALFIRLDAELSQRGCNELDFAYVTDNPSTPVIEKILRKSGWEPPQARMLLCRGDRRILEAPLIRRRRLPAGFSIFPWCELSADDRTAMRRQAWYPEMLSPFRDEEMQEPENSLGLRHHGQIVGWLITHRVSSTMIRYHSMFIRPEVRPHGCALPMIAEAIDRQARYRGLDSFGAFCVALDNRPMVKFVRHLTPHLLSVRESRGSHKRLTSDELPRH